jgi:outer membrane usher protein
LPSLHDRAWLGAAVLCAALLPAERASAAERVLVLEVVINGRATGRVAEFIDRDGTIFFRPSDLEELGLVLPPEVAANPEPIPFASLPNLRAPTSPSRPCSSPQATPRFDRRSSASERPPG